MGWFYVGTQVVGGAVDPRAVGSLIGLTAVGVRLASRTKGPHDLLLLAFLLHDSGSSDEGFGFR